MTAYAKRLEFQQTIMTDLKILAYFALLAMEQDCIPPNQYELISQYTTDCDYNKICSLPNLLKAHKAVRLGKRNRTEVILFEMNIKDIKE